MAQWMGMFTGHTHATKVEDLEAALNVAVSAWQSADEFARGRKWQAVRRIAKRLLAARLKMLRARLSELNPVAGAIIPNRDGIEALVNRIATIERDGLDGILNEFGARA